MSKKYDDEHFVNEYLEKLYNKIKVERRHDPREIDYIDPQKYDLLERNRQDREQRYQNQTLEINMWKQFNEDHEDAIFDSSRGDRRIAREKTNLDSLKYSNDQIKAIKNQVTQRTQQATNDMIRERRMANNMQALNQQNNMYPPEQQNNMYPPDHQNGVFPDQRYMQPDFIGAAYANQFSRVFNAPTQTNDFNLLAKESQKRITKKKTKKKYWVGLGVLATGAIAAGVVVLVLHFRKTLSPLEKARNSMLDKYVPMIQQDTFLSEPSKLFLIDNLRKFIFEAHTIEDVLSIDKNEPSIIKSKKQEQAMATITDLMQQDTKRDQIWKDQMMKTFHAGSLTLDSDKEFHDYVSNANPSVAVIIQDIFEIKRDKTIEDYKNKIQTSGLIDATFVAGLCSEIEAAIKPTTTYDTLNAASMSVWRKVEAEILAQYKLEQIQELQTLTAQSAHSDVEKAAIISQGTTKINNAQTLEEAKLAVNTSKGEIISARVTTPLDKLKEVLASTSMSPAERNAQLAKVLASLIGMKDADSLAKSPEDLEAILLTILSGNAH